MKATPEGFMLPDELVRTKASETGIDVDKDIKDTSLRPLIRNHANEQERVLLAETGTTYHFSIDYWGIRQSPDAVRTVMSLDPGETGRLFYRPRLEGGSKTIDIHQGQGIVSIRNRLPGINTEMLVDAEMASQAVILPGSFYRLRSGSHQPLVFSEYRKLLDEEAPDIGVRSESQPFIFPLDGLVVPVPKDI
jgi:hypothetical protein